MNDKIKILKVDECFQCCRHFTAIKNYKTGDREYVCGRKDKDIPDPFLIPEWCPLDDYSQETY